MAGRPRAEGMATGTAPRNPGSGPPDVGFEFPFGPTVVSEVIIEGELLAPPPVTRRMEVIGDSITAGYGNEGVAPCGFSAETENHYLTYASVAARTVGAELHTIAWSGKGMVYNFGDDTFQPLPELYDRTIASEDAGWSFEWQPDVVAVNLRANVPRPGGWAPSRAFARAMGDALRKGTDRLVVAFSSFAGGDLDQEVVRELTDVGVPFLESTETTMAALRRPRASSPIRGVPICAAKAASISASESF